MTTEVKSDLQKRLEAEGCGLVAKLDNGNYLFTRIPYQNRILDAVELSAALLDKGAERTQDGWKEFSTSNPESWKVPDAELLYQLMKRIYHRRKEESSRGPISRCANVMDDFQSVVFNPFKVFANPLEDQVKTALLNRFKGYHQDIDLKRYFDGEIYVDPEKNEEERRYGSLFLLTRCFSSVIEECAGNFRSFFLKDSLMTMTRISYDKDFDKAVISSLAEWPNEETESRTAKMPELKSLTSYSYGGSIFTIKRPASPSTFGFANFLKYDEIRTPEIALLLQNILGRGHETAGAVIQYCTPIGKYYVRKVKTIDGEEEEYRGLHHYDVEIAFPKNGMDTERAVCFEKYPQEMLLNLSRSPTKPSLKSKALGVRALEL